MGRPPCCDKASVKKGPWTQEEDLKLIAYTNSHGTGNWTSVPKKAGLKRCGKSCRLRWTNYLRPNLKHESFTPQEEDMIITLHATIGSRWSAIAHHLPGRTDNDIKNYWNTKLSKKLVQMGIDPITHHPISQVRESIANIQKAQQFQYHCRSSTSTSTAPHAGVGCLNRNLKNMFLSNKSATPLGQPFGITAAAASSSNEGASSSSSTAATSAAANRIDGQEEDLHWTDFIVEDVLIPDDRSSTVVGASAAGESVPVARHEFIAAATDFRAPCSTDSSTAFIDAILKQQEESMLSDFPEFLDDVYY